MKLTLPSRGMGFQPVRIRRIPPALFPFALLAFILCATPCSHAQYAGVQGTAEGQIARSEQTADYAKGIVAKGQKALASQDYESAFAYFKSAVDMLPGAGSGSATLRQQAMDGFCDAAVKLARQRISEGRFEDAKTTVAVVLEDRYNPNYKPAVALSNELKDKTSFYSQTMTPGFVANVEEVKQLLQEGQGFYASGRYDLAFKRYEQVLNVDKYNIAARRGMEQVNNARIKYQETAYNEARSDMVRQVNKAWELPLHKFDVSASQIIDQPQIDTRGTASINRKLDEIIIPKIDFRDATVREALDFIKQRAASLDSVEQDPARKGINIVLKLAPDAAESGSRITLSLTDVPLRAAIDYVARAANLKLKVEPYSVVVVPQSEATDVLITKEYKVPPSFITALPAGSGNTPAPVAGVAPGSQSAVTARSGAREFLEANGVTFPPGASANYISSSSRLIVKNSQSNLDLVDNLVENSMTAPPSQVEIESKFLEITQNNLKELGFDWLVGNFGLPFGTGTYGSGGTTPGGTVLPANAYPFMSGTTPVGATSSTQGPITSGNRSGTRAISVNAVDGLLFGSPLGPAPAVLALAGVFTNPQFQVVMRALNQSKGVDLVSAPKVTTKSGQRATIEIVREFRYPSEYDLPQVSSTTGLTQFTPVTPTTPTAFEMKPTGITLEVEPTVGPDGYTIELVLAPRVIEFDGFINYGSPINANIQYYELGVLLAQRTIVVTDNTINQPVFSTREVTTQVSVYDGQTVVLGGLMREDVQKVEDKVPILGDIPIAGRLFRTSADQHVKRNLIMFVTANLIDPAGQPLIRSDAEDQVVAVPNAAAIQSEAIPGDTSTIPLPQ
ncbi:MAG: type II and III secretion system protein [Verrucomicrobia bacterium]|nr:type II and III secretion system protein [Verrucomicrobiota bacterium]